MQKILMCVTETPSLRAKITGWKFESGDAVWNAYSISFNGPEAFKTQNDVPVELIENMSSHSTSTKYPTVLHALGDDWKLLGPPITYKQTIGAGVASVEMWEWWLVKG